MSTRTLKTIGISVCVLALIFCSIGIYTDPERQIYYCLLISINIISLYQITRS